MPRTISNKARKVLNENGVSAYKVSRAERRKRKGFADEGRHKNRGFSIRKES